jgi:hypothetical protein
MNNVHVIGEPHPAHPENIPALLRRLADSIEAGQQFGRVDSVAAVLVTGNGTIEVFGFGHADHPTSHFLLALGQRKLEGCYGEKP